MSKIKNGGLDQYGAEPFEQKQFGTAGVERIKGGQTSPRYRSVCITWNDFDDFSSLFEVASFY